MVGKANVTKWPIEIISDSDDLYYRIHKMFFNEDPNIIPSASFRRQGKSMSTDCDKYSSPERLRQRAEKPEENRILQMNVGSVRAIHLTVNHAPDHIEMNRAHTDILGLKNISKSVLNKIRSQLAIISDWVI